MKQRLIILLALALMGQSLSAQDQSNHSPYVDILAGLFPNLGDDGLNAHISAGGGVQFSNWGGVGLSLIYVGHSSVSTSQTLSGLGVQYRLLTPNHHQFLKLELGHLLGYKYTTDYTDEFRYEPGFDPYFKAYLGHRAGRFTFGVTYTHASGIQEGIWSYDDTLREHFDTKEDRMSRFDLFQFFIGFSLDGYPPTKRKKNKSQ